MSFHLEGFAALVVILIIFLIVGFILSLPLIIVFFIFGTAKRQAHTYMQAREHTVIAEYDPPAGLRPAEVGYLIEARSDEREYWATLLDLEARKIVSLIDNKELKVLDKAALAGCTDFEKTAIETYGKRFTSEQTANGAIIESSRNQFSTTLLRSMSEKGYMLGTQQVLVAYAKRIGIILLILAFWVVFIDWNIPSSGSVNGVPYDHQARSFARLGSAIDEFAFGTIIFWPVYLIVAIFLHRLITKRTGNYWSGTKKLRDIWPELEGYRLFLQKTDLDNLQYELKTGVPSSTNAKLLPYVIALNLRLDWKEYLEKRHLLS